VVRVSGYSTYLADLEQVVQVDIIARMEHAL
jgi:pyruvate-formate lyase